MSRIVGLVVSPETKKPENKKPETKKPEDKKPETGTQGGS